MIDLLAVLVLVALAYAWVEHGRQVRLRALVAEADAQVEVELQRRRDLLPALVAQVRAYEQHEAAVLAARGEDGLAQALLAVPAPQTGPLQQLQAQLAETEDRIAAARRFAVANRRALRVRQEGFPSGLVARALPPVEPEDPDDPDDP